MSRQLLTLGALLFVFTVGRAPSACAQTPPAVTLPPGTLQLAGTSPEARAAVLAGIDAAHSWSWKVAEGFFDKAVIADSTFGLARVMRAEVRNGPTVPILNAEYRRGLSDVAARPIPEHTFALARRAAAPNSAHLLSAMRLMVPNDRRVALDHALALAGRARLDSLRALSSRYTDYAAPRMWLAYWLTANQYIVSDSAGAEALATAQGAVRIAPNLSGTHAALGHVLHRLGRYDEALPHIARAIELDRSSTYSYELQSEIFMRDGKPRGIDRARTAIDSAVKYHPSVSRRSDLRRTAATLLMHDGRVAQMTAEHQQIAREAAAGGAPVYASTTLARLAVLLAGAYDIAGMDAQLAEARRLAPNNAALPELETIAYAIAARPEDARRTRASYLAAITDTTTNGGVVATRALLLLAERKPADAVAACAPPAPITFWCDFIPIEVNVMQGKAREAEALRSAYLARRNVENLSLGFAITGYRKLRPQRRSEPAPELLPRDEQLRSDFAAAPHTEPRKDVFDVTPNGVHADPERVGDFRIGVAAGELSGDLRFARRDPIAVAELVAAQRPVLLVVAGTEYAPSLAR